MSCQFPREQIIPDEKLMPIYNNYLNSSTYEILTSRRLITLVLDPYSHFNNQSSINSGVGVYTTNEFTQFKTNIEVGDFITKDAENYTVPTYGKTTSSLNGQYTTDYIGQMVNSGNIGNTGNILRLDRLYDIYLESMTTFNCVANTSSSTMGFFLNINNWGIDNNSNISNNLNSIFIPNEASTTGTTVTHKAKKLNFITSLVPKDIKEITGSITCLDGSTIFDSPVKPASGPSQGRIVIEFLLVPRKQN